MTKPYLSVIIPTYNRVGLLHWHLDELSRQTLSRDEFEVVVVEDGGGDSQAGLDWKSLPYNIRWLRQENSGPAAARNLGASQATGDILLFCGDDCIPNRNLLFRHHLRHKENVKDKVIQGFTDWHPNIPPDTFMMFLNNGLQANWGGLRDKNTGVWASRDANIPGWFLTTNVSIPKRLFDEHGGFDKDFPHAAWEDIELSLRLSQLGVETNLEVDAQNYHWHKQTLDSFARRQEMEGGSRIVLVAKHFFMAHQMFSVDALREASRDRFMQAMARARELHYNEYPEAQEARYKYWQEAMQLASLQGVRAGLNKRSETCPVWKAIEHLHLQDAANHISACASDYEKGDFEKAMVNLEWAARVEPDAWVMEAARGEVYLAMGQKSEAQDHFRRSMAASGGEDWPTKRFTETHIYGNK